MVNGAETLGIDPAGGHPERVLALGYAPAGARPAVSALFALDRTLARLTLGTRDPLVAQLRLAWWDEALRGLMAGDVPAQPILRALAEQAADGEMLATMVDGWQRLLDTPDDAALAAFGDERGVLFGAAARAAGATDETAAAGQGWALVDLAGASADAGVARRARALAAPLLARAAAQRWSAAARFLGALVHSARADLAARGAPGSPRRVARLAWHRLSGR